MFPAWFELHADDVVVAQPTALRVYAVLLRNPLIFSVPQRAPAWFLAGELRMKKPRAASKALSLLIERGYVLDHDRAVHARQGDRARYVTVPMQRAPIASPTMGPQNDPPRAAGDRNSA